MNWFVLVMDGIKSTACLDGVVSELSVFIFPHIF